MPGFIDSHGHFIMNAVFRHNFVDCSCAPIGQIKDMDNLIHVMQEAATKKQGKDALIGFGFDDTLIKEYRMPTAEDLDRISTHRPVIILHTSIHMLSANTYAMKAAKVWASFNVPAGGKVYFDQDKHPDGIFEEAAIQPLMKKFLFMNMFKGLFKAINTGSIEYLSQGITTANEGASFKFFHSIYKLAKLKKDLQTRLVLCPAVNNDEKKRIGEKQWQPLDRNGYLWLGPAKIVSDGSIQAHTAYLSKPYHTIHPTRPKASDYCGFPSIEQDMLLRQIKALHLSKRQCAIHCNGDAALDMVLDAFNSVQMYGAHDLRHIIIHCQTVREDQLKRMKELGLSPSFFPAHIYVWGDRHYSRFLGPERAKRINPIKSALKLGMRYSLHNDAPVTPIFPLGLVDAAVNRTTSGGMILGEEQRVNTYEALLGVTYNAAWQYHLEDYLGTIEKGKYADFVILNSNPLKVNPKEIADISIESTIVGGQFRYKKPT